MVCKVPVYAGRLGLFFFHGERRVDVVCDGQQWSSVPDTVDYLTYLQEIGTSTRRDTRSLTLASVCLMRTI